MSDHQTLVDDTALKQLRALAEDLRETFEHLWVVSDIADEMLRILEGLE